MMTSASVTTALADTLRARPTVHVGGDVDRDVRDSLVEWAPSRGLEVTERGATLTITPHISGLTLPSDVVTSLDAALAEIRDGIRPTSAVAQDRGY